MKKLLTVLTIMVGLCVCGCGCAKVKPESNTYTAYGRYYTDGTVITEDGNVWGYHTNSISNKVPEDHMPVWIAFDDNGTPDKVEDDIILGCVHDKVTSIYDTLEEELNDQFVITRDGNYIKIDDVR
jgi:uncharacterized protein YceK